MGPARRLGARPPTWAGKVSGLGWARGRRTRPPPEKLSILAKSPGELARHAGRHCVPCPYDHRLCRLRGGGCGMARPDPRLTASRGGARRHVREHQAEPWPPASESACTLAGLTQGQRAALLAHYLVERSAAGARGAREDGAKGPCHEGCKAWEQKEVGVRKKLCRREASPRAVRLSKRRTAPFQLAK